MSEICLHPEKLLGLLTEIGRHRALTDEETDIVEAILEIEHVPFRWNARLDGHLLTASHSVGGIARFARRHGITPMAAYSRIKRLKDRQTRKDAPRLARG
jgi:hypothetical protein